MSLKIEIDHINEKNRRVQHLPRHHEPEFAKYEPDLQKIRNTVKDEHDFENLVVIGNGGSITSFRAYLYAFLPETDVDVRLVTTMDPDYLNRISSELRPEDTLVMPISRSGDTVGVIESLLYFMNRDYPVFAVTSDDDGALKQIVEREELDWIRHPDVEGRFSGATETALVPAAFSGMPIEQIRKGAEEMYDKLSPENQYNPALNIASAFYDAEQKGYENIFGGFYATRMFGFYPLFVQLMHETVCKKGKGQDVSGDLGPEFQHHTNQRIFGGKKDVLPVFFRTENHEHQEIRVPEELKDVNLRGRELGLLEGRSYQGSLESEYRGVKQALDQEDMPNVTVSFTEMSHEAAGKMVAFLQYVAVYSAWLRDVDPFTQPDVEKSKKLGFEQRFK